MVGVAVKVTEAPAQIDVLVAVMLTDAGVVGVTVIVRALLVDVGAVTQVNELVKIHVKTSPFEIVLVVNVALLVPTFVPFLCHW